MYSQYTGSNPLSGLVGETVTKVEINESYLVITTETDTFAYFAFGDCCSYSFFYEMIGVQKLLTNGRIVSVDRWEVVQPENPDDDPNEVWGGDFVQAYGYQMVTVDPLWGEVTSGVVFRNESNGYYGGSLERVVGDLDRHYMAMAGHVDTLRELTEDVHDIPNLCAADVMPLGGEPSLS